MNVEAVAQEAINVDLSAARRPFIIRIADQVVPSLLTAMVMGIIGWNVLVYKVDELMRRDAEQSMSIATHTIQITQNQERQIALANAFADAVARLDRKDDSMDGRVRRLEERPARQ